MWGLHSDGEQVSEAGGQGGAPEVTRVVLLKVCNFLGIQVVGLKKTYQVRLNAVWLEVTRIYLFECKIFGLKNLSCKVRYA